MQNMVQEIKQQEEKQVFSSDQLGVKATHCRSKCPYFSIQHDTHLMSFTAVMFSYFQLHHSASDRYVINTLCPFGKKIMEEKQAAHRQQANNYN